MISPSSSFPGPCHSVYNSVKSISLSEVVADGMGFFAYSGMAPIIRAILSNLVGEEVANEIRIIANDVVVFPDGKWEIQYRHPSRWVTTFPAWLILIRQT